MDVDCKISMVTQIWSTRLTGLVMPGKRRFNEWDWTSLCMQRYKPAVESVKPRRRRDSLSSNDMLVVPPPEWQIVISDQLVSVLCPL